MKPNLLQVTGAGAIILATLFSATTTIAAPIDISFTATIQASDGTYSGLLAGQTISGIYTTDTDEANADSIETTPGTVPGHEFTSFYEFYNSVYGVTLSLPDGSTFENRSFAGMVMNNDLELTAEETNGAVSDGHYDWIEILGSTASDVGAAHTPGNGQEWTLAFIADDANWFTDGSVIPDDLPPISYTALLIGVDLDSNGDEIGFVFASVGDVTILPAAISPVPIPPAAWLFGSGLLGLVGIARRKA